jgi:hypothetical protein
MILGVFPLTAHADGPGTAGAAFLNIGMGTRASGMGGAFTGISDDASAIYYNPAGLTQLRMKELSLLHTRWLGDVEAQYLGLATPFGEESAFGISGTYLHTEDIERDILGEEKGIFQDYYKNLALSYARAITRDLSIGGTLKWIHGSLAEYGATTYGLDMGFLYTTPLRGLTLGATIQNLGWGMKFIEEEDPLPLNFRFGLGYRPIEEIILGLDLRSPLGGGRSHLGLGGEYRIAKILNLRAGFSQKGDDEFPGLTCGVGIELFGLRLDYAWVPYGDLGETGRYSLLLRLDTSPPSKPLIKDEGEFTKSRDTLHFSFSSEDPESGIEGYRYGLGREPGKVDVVPWRTIRDRGEGWREISLRGLQLVDGATYYLSVRTKNRGGLFSRWSKVGISDGITVDSTPPTTPVVEMKMGKASLKASWRSEDHLSGIREYLYALGTTPKGIDVTGWREAGSRTDLAISKTDLVDGVTYYLSVKAIDLAGNTSGIGVSDGVLVDRSPPSSPSIKDEGQYTTSSDRLRFHLKSDDPHSGIMGYRYALGTTPGGGDILGWREGKGEDLTLEGLSLKDGVTYYLSAISINGAGIESPIGVSDGVMVDTSPPSEPLVKVRTEKWEMGKILLEASFSSEDPQSGVVEYQYAILRDPGGVDLVEWTSSQEKTIIEITGLDPLACHTYYISVKARNGVGLWSEVGTSDGITIERRSIPRPKKKAKDDELIWYGEGGIKIGLRVHREHHLTRIYVKIRNIGDYPIYNTAIRNFTLITKDGKSHRPSLSLTYTHNDPLYPKELQPGKETMGFILFETSSQPISLTYKDLFHSPIHMTLQKTD